MSKSGQIPETTRFAAEVSDAFLRRAFLLHLGAFSTDMLARLSILEGAAGKTPGSWIDKRERGFGDALSHFGPSLAPAWTSPSDQGVYDKAISAANHAMRGAVSMDAADLVQEMIAGSSSAASPRRSRLFYSVGEQLRKFEHDLGQGKIFPSDSKVKGTIEHWVQGHARDVFRSTEERNTQLINTVPSSGKADYFTQSRGTSGLTRDQRDSLLLLAIQSPGGPGRELRDLIDALVDRAFTPTQRPIVRMFLSELGGERYRSIEEMKKAVPKFNPDKWFTHAFNLIRTEIMTKMGISPQQLTNALGGRASRVFEFMQNVVGKDSRVQSIIGQLADDVELLEPGYGQKVAETKDREESSPLPVSPYSVMREWFEKDRYGEWGDQSTPLSQFAPGPVSLRVAQAWLHKQST